MKNICRNTLVALLLMVNVSSCDYLDVIPDNVATIEYAFRNRTEAERYLYTLYSYIPNIGNLNAPEHLGCDEAWEMNNSDSRPNGLNIGLGYQNAADPYMDYWTGGRGGKPLWIAIRDCNIFLEQVEGVKDLSETEMRRWISEAKFLKAYYHFYLLRMYGPIPIMDNNLDVSASPDEVKVYREPFDDVVIYISNLLDEAYENLPQENELIEALEAGRITRVAAKTLKAKLLVMAASPLFNGNTDYANIVDNRGVHLFNQTYDENKWRIAADACKEAIDIADKDNKKLYMQIMDEITDLDKRFERELILRNSVTDKWNCELIWGKTQWDQDEFRRDLMARIVRVNPDNTWLIRSEFAAHNGLVSRFYSSHGVPIEEDKEWLAKGWYAKRNELRPEPSSGDEVYYVRKNEQTAYQNYNREPRFYAFVGFDRGIYFGCGYTKFDSTSVYETVPDDGVKDLRMRAREANGLQSMQNNHSRTGYVCKKLVNYKSSVTYSKLTFEYYPFPILRLTDLYLLYAEALNEAQGPNAETYKYLDLIRERAGLEGVVDSWNKYSNNPQKTKSKEGLREIIQRERNIELCFEHQRFWDLRRWKKITEIEQPRGWNIQGETAEEYYRVLPVESSVITFSTRDYLWPIKESEMIINKNLVQNYGW